MRRAAKITAWSVATLLLLTGVLGGALFIAGNTAGGRHFLERLTARLSQGDILIAGLSGSLPASLDLHQLTLRDAQGTWLTAEGISLRWSPWQLLARHLQIERLTIAGLQIVRLPQAQGGSSPGSARSLPHIDVAALGIDELDLGAALAGTPAAVSVQGSAHLASLQNAALKVSVRRTDGPGDYEIALRFDRTHLNAQLTLQEPDGGPLANLLRIPGLGALALQATLTGPREQCALHLDMSAGALRARVQGSLDLPLQSADLEYSLHAAAMTLRPGLGWQSVALDGRWHGSIATPTASAQLHIAALQAARIQARTLDATLQARAGTMSVLLTAGGLVLPGPQPQLLQNAPLTVQAELHLDEPARSIAFTASHSLFTLRGHADTAGVPTADLQLTLPALAPLAGLAGMAVQGSAILNAQLTEKRGAVRAAVNGRIAVRGGAAPWPGLLGESAQFEVVGTWKDRQLEIERAQLKGRTLSFLGQGHDDGSALDAKWDAMLTDLRALSPDLVGTLTSQGRLQGRHEGFSVDTDLQSSLAVGDSPRGSVTASLHAQDLPAAPRGSLRAQGTFDGAPLRLEVDLTRDAQRRLRATVRHADWKSAHVEGELSSAADGGQARGHFALRMARLEDLQHLIAAPLRGSLSGALDLRPVAGRVRVGLQLDAQNVSANGVAASARLQASGAIDALALRLDARLPDLDGAAAVIAARATLNAGSRRLGLTTASAAYRGQTLRLLAPAQLAFGDGVAVDRLRLGFAQAWVELRGRLSPQLDLRASLRNVTPALVNIFRPDLLAAGTLQADLQLTGSAAMPLGRVQVSATGVRLQGAAARALPAGDLHADAQLMGNTASVEVQLGAGTQSRMSLTGRVPLDRSGSMQLQARGNIDVTLVNPLLEAGGRRAAGQLNIEANIDGAWTAPRITGTLGLVHGDLRDYAQGVHLTDISAQLEGAEGALRVVSLTARAGRGGLSLTGTIGVLQPGIPVDLVVSAKNAQPIASPLITAALDANLTVRGRAREHLDVAGRIQVTRADIGIPGSFPPEVAVLDVRRPGEAKAAPAAPALQIGLDVTLAAPRAIFVQGRGLDAELGGELRVGGTMAFPVVGGGFDLQRGSFTLASTRLQFSSGRVSFDGAGLKKTIDPTLDFVATTTTVGTTVTLTVSGYADAPQFALTSSPVMPQDEVLARLLFGQSVTQLGGLQLAQIGVALASLSGVGGSGLNPLAAVQKRLGLDRLSVGSSSGPDSSGTSFEAGRYVSDRVYVGAKQSTNGSTQLKMEVNLSTHLKLQTSVGNGGGTVQGVTPDNDPGSSVGVAYQIEF